MVDYDLATFPWVVDLSQGSLGSFIALQAVKIHRFRIGNCFACKQNSGRTRAVQVCAGHRFIGIDGMHYFSYLWLSYMSIQTRPGSAEIYGMKSCEADRHGYTRQHILDLICGLMLCCAFRERHNLFQYFQCLGKTDWAIWLMMDDELST